MHLAHTAGALGLALFAACGSTTPKVAGSVAPPPSLAPPLEHESITRQDPAADTGDEWVAESTPEEQPAPAAPAEQGASASEALPLGLVAGTPIYAEDLLVEWHQIAGREVEQVVEKIVTTRLAFAEAQRLGMRLAPEAVALRMEFERGRLKETVEAFELGLDVDEYLRTELGVRPEQYFERMRAAVIRQMLAERAVRAWTLSNETVALRLIVVADEEEMQQIQELLAAGADFGELARKHSIDDTAPLGGYVPYLIRQEHAVLTRLAFSTQVGEIGGPLPIGERRFLIRVEERRGQLAGNWASIEAAVEESLDAYGLSDTEFVHWSVAMRARYPIDLRRLDEILGTEG